MRGNVRVRDGDRTAQQRPRPSPTRGWIGQVVSGGLLLVLVTVHMVANHFVVRGWPAELRTGGGLRGRAQRATGRVLAGLGLTTVAYGLWLLATIASKA